MDIIYTKVDEAPELASGSFLPIIQAFTAPASISVGTKDISLAGRILAQFSEYLTTDQFQSDDLNELGELVKTSEANVIKLPNISASISQLKAAITELQQKGYHIPDYPDNPQTQEEKDTQAKYDSVKGSAVNPVLREGNSDRRAPRAVKQYAKQNPHSMGKWIKESKTHVSSMSNNDFFSNENSNLISNYDIPSNLISIISEGEIGLYNNRKNRNQIPNHADNPRIPVSTANWTILLCIPLYRLTAPDGSGNCELTRSTQRKPQPVKG